MIGEVNNLSELTLLGFNALRNHYLAGYAL
jgi:hypothetical protein